MLSIAESSSAIKNIPTKKVWLNLSTDNLIPQAVHFGFLPKPIVDRSNANREIDCAEHAGQIGLIKDAQRLVGEARAGSPGRGLSMEWVGGWRSFDLKLPRIS